MNRNFSLHARGSLPGGKENPFLPDASLARAIRLANQLAIDVESRKMSLRRFSSE